MRSLVVDTDTASDDAVALLLAARTPGVGLRAVTTVAGNVDVAQATRNALVTLELAGADDVEVYAGLARPLLRPLETARFVHGEDGMSDVDLPDPRSSIIDEHAVDALRRIARDEPWEHHLVMLGPMTNVAAALVLDPELLTRFRSTYAMAGAFDGVGNVDTVGEYNVWADPEAAELVFSAPGDLTCIGWDASRRFAVMTSDEQAALRSLGRLGRFACDINRALDVFAREVSGLSGYDLPDPLAMAVAIDPTIVTRRSPHHVTIGRDDIARGGTMIDHRRTAPEPNANVVWEVDESRFKAMLTSACSEGAA